MWAAEPSWAGGLAAADARTGPVIRTGRIPARAMCATCRGACARPGLARTRRSLESD